MRTASILAMTVCLVGCSSDFQINRAHKLEKKGKTYKAWQKYQEFAADNPKHPRAPEALFYAGWLAQRKLNDCPMASVFYEQVVEKYPQADPWGRLAAHQKVNCPDYFPLLPGFEWVEGDSSTQGKNARIETVCKADPEKGAFPSEAGMLVRTIYAGKEKFKTAQILYKKLNGELLESVESEAGQKIIFKMPPVVGTRWRTKAQQRLYTYEVLAIDMTVKVAAGEFGPCVLVKSTVDGISGDTLEYYAPGVGKILTAYATPQGEKRNTELLSYNPMPNIEFNLKETPAP